MANLVFNIDNVSVTSYWTVYRDLSSTGAVESSRVGNIVTGKGTRKIVVSGIPAGEHVTKAVLTADISTTGATSGGSKLTINGLSFGGTRKLDALEFVEGLEWTAEFANTAYGSEVWGNDEQTTYSITKNLTNIVLTLTTGTGSVFDGRISSLNEGDKLIIVEEPEGARAEGTAIVIGSNVAIRKTASSSGTIVTRVATGEEVVATPYNNEWSAVTYGSYSGYMMTKFLSTDSKGTYSLVHHNYNEGKALFFRDSSYGLSAYRSSNSYGGYIDSALDKYLINTFVAKLPDETSRFLQEMDYLVASSANSSGTATTITRMAATISGIESGLSSNEMYGTTPWDYTNTVNSGIVYWTRESVSGTNNYARAIGTSGELLSNSVTTTNTVRPTVGVLEDQLVIYSEKHGGYIFCTKCTAPEKLYINGSDADVSGLGIEANLVLSWSAGDVGHNADISGYAVWYSTSEDGVYELYGITTETSMAIIGPGKGFQEYYFKVQTLGPEEADYCNSELSAAVRVIATKRSNVYYYDGNKWLLATTKYYNGSAWTVGEGMKYYNGSSWLDPS